MVIDFKNLIVPKSNNIGEVCNNAVKRIKDIKIKMYDSKITDMTEMFCNCWRLQTLDLSNFDTSRVTYMSRMFRYCPAIQTLDLSSFDTSKVKNMNGMFWECARLQELDLSSFDTSNVNSMNGMFRHCTSLKTVKLPKDERSRQKLIDQLNKDGIQCTII